MKNIFLLLCSLYLTMATAQTITINGPSGSKSFGEKVYTLPNGNFVVVDSKFNDGALLEVGAVYLYNGATKQLISTLKGDQDYDRVGFGGILILANGNYVVKSEGYRGNLGAYTFCNATTGVNGVVSLANSILGTVFTEKVAGKIYALPNGNYVICSPNWLGNGNNSGAATWCNGTTGRVGNLSASTSLVGAVGSNDRIGTSITILSDGNYTVNSENYSANKGAVTYCNGATGLIGTASATNSLVGNVADTFVGKYVTALTNGNYVVCAPEAFGNLSVYGKGAVALCKGAVGVLDQTNSFTGSQQFYGIGVGGIAPLTNGNFVINSYTVKNNSTGIQDTGAATWCSGVLSNGANIGGSVAISSTNSITGTNAGDRVGFTSTALPNGNYLVASPQWKNGTIIEAGAVTWASGIQPTALVVSSSNSLVGSTAYDNIGATSFSMANNSNTIAILPNSNYVVSSSTWDNNTITDAGAATFCIGTAATTGTINAANSLIGNYNNVQVGEVVTVLSTGDYVVGSPNYTNSSTTSGAATWGSKTTGVSGLITTANSLTGPYTLGNQSKTGSQVLALSNGNYVVLSEYNFGNGKGAATLCKANGSNVGFISVNNSITCTSGQISIGNKLIALTNGNYLIHSPALYVGGIKVGALTLANGANSAAGKVTNCNSIFGTVVDDIIDVTDKTNFNNTQNFLITGAPTFNNNKVFIFDEIEATTLGSTSQNEIVEIIGIQPINIVKNCEKIAILTPNGANPISGTTAAKVWIETTQPTNFVKRHYEISPTNNSANATARVKLYFTQQEFNDFNAINGTKLPQNSNDTAGKANVLIEKIGGSSNNNSGLPNSYSGATTTINPVDADVVWNAQNSNWEVSFDVTGFSGFFVKTAATSLDLETFSTQKATLFPNPVKDIFSIQSENSISKIEIFSLLGQQVLSAENTNQVNATSLQKGIYIVKVTTEGNEQIFKITKE